ncbi:LAQU0S01e02872g1_1 [Lachancea quebecensis]|uniref:DNA repair protein RAD59 n=1 Tax=Lachancea quebecensis TaxID=1654605 RepID=A0A0P1KL27_9SACH|nr:LAQU0S01e02872g1_1 [Lachancea quebecensis]
MSAYLTNLSYENAVYATGAEVTDADVQDLQIVENWLNRPASEWAVQKIGVLQSKIEQYSYRIYHSSRYGKHPIAKLIPAFTLIQYANEALGYDGWSLEVTNVNVTSFRQVSEEAGAASSSESTVEPKYEVLTEAHVKVVLKDGTYTQSEGFGKSISPNKGDCYNKSKKEAINNALKKSFLKFETMVLDHEKKVASNYYVDGLYGSRRRSKQPS